MDEAPLTSKNTLNALKRVHAKKRVQTVPQDDEIAPEPIKKRGRPSNALKEEKLNTEPSGGPVPVKTEEERKSDAERKEKIKKNKEMRKSLNESALFLLSCLEPGFKKDWMEAAEEQRVKDIGVYVLGVLNRLSKMVDYMEYDIEPEWEQGVIGYNEQLYCEYCKKEIELTRTTNLRQRFCSNLCAKRYEDAHKTGIVFPADKFGPSEEAMEEKKWMKENKRDGVVSANAY